MKVDPVYTALLNQTVADLPQTPEWKTPIAALAPEGTAEEELPKIRVMDLVREALLRARRKDEKVSEYAQRLNVESNSLSDFLRGKKPFIKASKLGRALHALAGAHELPLDKLKAFLTEASQLAPKPWLEEEKAPKVTLTAEESKEAAGRFRKDDEIGRHLGHFSNPPEERKAAYSAERNSFKAWINDKDNEIAKKYPKAVRMEIKINKNREEKEDRGRG